MNRHRGSLTKQHPRRRDPHRQHPALDSSPGVRRRREQRRRLRRVHITRHASAKPTFCRYLAEAPAPAHQPDQSSHAPTPFPTLILSALSLDRSSWHVGISAPPADPWFCAGGATGQMMASSIVPSYRCMRAPRIKDLQMSSARPFPIGPIHLLVCTRRNTYQIHRVRAFDCLISFLSAELVHERIALRGSICSSYLSQWTRACDDSNPPGHGREKALALPDLARFLTQLPSHPPPKHRLVSEHAQQPQGRPLKHTHRGCSASTLRRNGSSVQRPRPSHRGGEDVVRVNPSPDLLPRFYLPSDAPQ